MQKGILVCRCPSMERCRVRMWVTACPYLPLNPFTAIGSLSGVALRFKNLAVLIAHAVSIKANLFALVSVRACKSIPYPLCDIVYGIVKCFPPINWLKSIMCRLVLHPKTEFSLRVLLFPTPTQQRLRLLLSLWGRSFKVPDRTQQSALVCSSCSMWLRLQEG